MPRDHDERRRSREPSDHRRSREPSSSSAAERHESSQSARMPRQPRVRFAPPLSAPLLAQVATMSGFLKKQADNEPGKWTNYFFVLKPTTYLYYYTKPDDDVPRGIIDLEFLRDVRFNGECLERSVGASPNGFRVTGKLPSRLCPADKDPSKTQFRPVHLDADSRDVADAWMEAFKHHRFDLARHRDYDDLVDSMEEMDEQLTALSSRAKELASASQAVLRKGKELVCTLRGVDPDDELGRPLGMSHHEDDIASTIRSIGSLLEEMFSEADRHRRHVELLRQREEEYFQREANLKGADADLRVQRKRCEHLEQEVERLMEERRIQQREFDDRYADLVARERQLQADEKERALHFRRREQELEQKLQEMNQKSAKWEKEMEKEAAKKNLEFEKKRKALEKQQKTLEQKQKQLDKRLKETPPKTLFAAVGAIGKSKSATPAEPTEATTAQETVEEDPEDAEPSVAVAAAVPATTTKAKTRFMPGFLSKKGNTRAAQDESSHEEESASSQEEDLVQEDSTPVKPEPLPVHQEESSPPPAIPRRLTVEEEMDYFDSQADLDIRPFQMTPAQHAADRSSTASTARLSGLSYTSSDSNNGTSRPRRSFTTGAISPPARKSPASKRFAAEDAVTAVYGGITVRLPPEWTYKESKSYIGRFFYYNRLTKETRWEFPFEAVVHEDQAAVSRESSRLSHRSSFDDGNDFMSQDESENETPKPGYRSRAATQGGRAMPEVLATKIRRQTDAVEHSRWEPTVHEESELDRGMNHVSEEPEDDADDEDGQPTANKAKSWNRKFPRLRAKTKAQPLEEGVIHEMDCKGFADTAAYRAARAKTVADLSSSEEPAKPKAAKAWKIPKVPFRKGKTSKAATPHAETDDEPSTLQDATRCEF